ncbi:MAG: valine--tRNA ligase [Armatimonadetes bacterium]|nr:valine--tRNA ligase [Armatimonadota bacterium]
MTNNQQTTLSTVYDPTDVESKWYKFWLDKDYFHAEVNPSRPKYCITIPPPNVTGSLHIGHALCYTIQDVLIRWKRMQGFNALCLPGTDHAGIATQNKVEQQLAEEGLTRHDLGREKFLERVWAWKKQYGGQILHQFKKMGFSFDWKRERFTMDEGYIDAVLEAFVRLFDKGYIYRGARVINWCPRCHTAISDIEVEYVEDHSHLWRLRYPLEDGSGYVVVATTRPETMLGDTAVAVNPSDERYLGVMGKNVRLPLTDRMIPMIEDDHVDPEFGTGAVKVTPAHDPNDFEIGLRHNLPQVVVIAPDGSMTADAGERYAGLDRYEARKKVVADLEAQGLLDGIDDYTHSVGTCARCDTVIEPLLSEQWFCKMKELAAPAIEVVKRGEVKFIPDRYKNIYIEWMENVRDWCISRQLWWGHRIPVYTCDECGQTVAAKSKAEAVEKLKCGHGKVTQEEDVLDTWFSSALWPFATLGWPKQTPELNYFYPTDVLVTARDIIYLWVARMIFSGIEYLDKIPFDDVYIYATVMNEEGKRMSKSLGTGVDPLESIATYGSDALRFALIQQTGKNQDIRFSDKRVEQIRNFCNKIWNASRFVIMNLDDFDPRTKIDQAGLRLEDQWIVSRLQDTIVDVNDGLKGYDMDKAARALYEFIWDHYCDWYIELAKPRLREGGGDRTQVQAILCYVLDVALCLLHPIMPFITEEIWQALPHKGESIMVAPYPQNDPRLKNQRAEVDMETIIGEVRQIRSLRADIGVAPGKVIDVLAVCPQYARNLIEPNLAFIKRLAKVNEFRFVDSIPEEDMSKYMSSHEVGSDLYVEVAGLIDIEKELTRIGSELASIEKDLARSSGKLASESFTSKAPEEIVEKEKKIVAELSEKKQRLEERKAALSN